MAKQYMIRKRGKYPLVVLEMMGLSAYGAYWLCQRYGWDWVVGIAIALASIFFLGMLFFTIRFFRYVFAVGFSLCWAVIAYGLTSLVSKSELSMGVAALLVFLAVLAAHRSYFNFTKNSEQIDYREY